MRTSDDEVKSGVLNGWGLVTNLKQRGKKQKILRKEKLDLVLAKTKCPNSVIQSNQFCAGVKKSE